MCFEPNKSNSRRVSHFNQHCNPKASSTSNCFGPLNARRTTMSTRRRRSETGETETLPEAGGSSRVGRLHEPMKQMKDTVYSQYCKTWYDIRSRCITLGWGSHFIATAVSLLKLDVGTCFIGGNRIPFVLLQIWQLLRATAQQIQFEQSFFNFFLLLFTES